MILLKQLKELGIEWMKNKERYKYYGCILIALIIFLSIFFFIHQYEYQKYTITFNEKVNNLVVLLKDKGISKEEIINILNTKNSDNNFQEYGIDLELDSVLILNDDYYKLFMLIELVIIILLVLIVIKIFSYYNKKKDEEIATITECIRQINAENYKLDLDSFKEGDLAILKEEIRKITTMLKSMAQNNLDAKINLKNSLEDISHQIKTPLTSILINLDNLIENPSISASKREEFLRTIKKDVNHIEFLVTSILKLSKFDAGTIKFNASKVNVRDLLEQVKSNVSTISDLKNVDIVIENREDIYFICDYRWQIEALTNIVKNCLEYSPMNTQINISYSQNKIYTLITIADMGGSIKKEDLPHIFERFYKGSNASSESVGIGLSLAKTIINKDKGHISVVSNEDGSKFTIKYFRI